MIKESYGCRIRTYVRALITHLQKVIGLNSRLKPRAQLSFINISIWVLLMTSSAMIIGLDLTEISTELAFCPARVRSQLGSLASAPY